MALWDRTHLLAEAHQMHSVRRHQDRRQGGEPQHIRPGPLLRRLGQNRTADRTGHAHARPLLQIGKGVRGPHREGVAQLWTQV